MRTETQTMNNGHYILLMVQNLPWRNLIHAQALIVGRYAGDR